MVWRMGGRVHFMHSGDVKLVHRLILSEMFCLFCFVPVISFFIALGS